MLSGLLSDFRQSCLLLSKVPATTITIGAVVHISHYVGVNWIHELSMQLDYAVYCVECSTLYSEHGQVV